MTLAFHVPGSTDGWLRRLDARWKIAAFMVAIAGASCATGLDSVFLAAAAAIALARCGCVSSRRLYARIVPIVSLLIVFFGWAVFRPRPGEITSNFYGVPLSRFALAMLFAIVCKTVAVVTFILTLFEATPLPELGQGAAALGVPRLFVHLVLLTQRYIYVLAEEFARLRRALRVRGYRNRCNRRSFATIGAVAGTLVVRGHEQADRVYHAMAARGFDGVFRSLSAPRSALADIAFFVTTALQPSH